MDTVNDEQEKVIVAPLNCINIVTAGPGSGKTSVLVNRGLYLLNNSNDNNHMILLLTYSREACNQLKDRLQMANHMNNSNLNRFKVETYHSLSLQLIKRYYNLCGYTSSPKKASDKEILQLIDTFMISNSNLFNYNGQDIDSKKLYKIMKVTRERFFNLTTSDDSVETCFQTLENASSFINLYRYLQHSLKSNNKIMDFQDMIYEAISMLRLENNRLMILNEMKFKYILVDEFQDTNYRQLQLLKLIMDNKSPNLTVVGDRDQLIYKFQGANENNWGDLRRHLSSLGVPFIISQLNNNFRSSDIIVKCSNVVINSNKQTSYQKKSVAVGICSSTCNPIAIIECSSEKDQYSYIVNKIRHLLNDSNNSNPIAMNEIAILYRNNNKGEAFSNYISNEARDSIKINHKKSIDVTNINSNDGSKKKNILINKLKLIINSADNDALRKCIPISKNEKCNEVVSTIIGNTQRHNGNMFDAINNAVKQKVKHISNMKNFCSSVLELNNWMLNNDISLYDFISKVCNSVHDAIDSSDDLTTEKLMEIVNNYDNKNSRNLCQEVPKLIEYIEQALICEVNKPGVWLSTIHCAKGLEFRCVFILEANNEIFQTSPNGNDNELELLYVAISRAKEHLFITWISNSNNVHNGISEFLKPLLNLPTDKVIQEFYSSSVQKSSTTNQLLKSSTLGASNKFMKSSELLSVNNSTNNNAQISTSSSSSMINDRTSKSQIFDPQMPTKFFKSSEVVGNGKSYTNIQTYNSSSMKLNQATKQSTLDSASIPSSFMKSSQLFSGHNNIKTCNTTQNSTSISNKLVKSNEVSSGLPFAPISTSMKSIPSDVSSDSMTKNDNTITTSNKNTNAVIVKKFKKPYESEDVDISVSTIPQQIKLEHSESNDNDINSNYSNNFTSNMRPILHDSNINVVQPIQRSTKEPNELLSIKNIDNEISRNENQTNIGSINNINDNMGIVNRSSKNDGNKTISKPFSLFAKFIPQSSNSKRKRET